MLLFSALLLASAPPVAHAQQNATGNVDQLVEQLNDGDSAIRSSAAVALAGLGPAAKDAVPNLIERLRDEDSDVRRSAARALGAMGADAEAALPTLTEMLAQEDDDVGRSVARALGAILEAVADRRVKVTVEDGRLSVQVEDVTLEALLEKISSQTKGMAIEMGDGVANQRVSVEFSDLPLDQGLRQILSGQDAFFYYRGDFLMVVWVYRYDEGRGLYPIPAEQWASTEEFEEWLSDPDPEGRVWALEALIERKGDQAQNEVLQALNDHDERVRISAIYGAVDEGIDLPPETLSDLALKDPSYKVRFLALQALAGDPNLDFVASYALDDPNPVIRLYAESILDRLDRADSPSEPSQPAQGQRQVQ